MGSGAMIYIPSFIRAGSDIQKLLGDTHTYGYRQQGGLTSLLLFFQNKENGLKMNIKERESEVMDYIQLAQDRVH
jgi:predicted AlkP superfamily phosphohydrolase/phosphomutase